MTQSYVILLEGLVYFNEGKSDWKFSHNVN
jgi:hypothetical protein